MEPPLRAGRLAGRLLRAPSLPPQASPWPRARGSSCSGPSTSGRRLRLPRGCRSSATSRSRSFAPGG
eukprot:8680902-Alexandrium_andersonii.AAC.1